MTSAQDSQPADHLAEDVDLLHELASREAFSFKLKGRSKIPLWQLLAQMAYVGRLFCEHTGVEGPSQTSLPSGLRKPDATYIKLPTAKLFACREFLEEEVEITEVLEQAMNQLLSTGYLFDMSESTMTRSILEPMVAILLYALSGSAGLVKGSPSREWFMEMVREWNVSSLARTEGGGTVVQIGRSIPHTEAQVRVGAMNAKAPSACGDGKAQNVVDLVKEIGTRQLLAQMSAVKGKVQTEPLAVTALVWLPTHFVPVIGRGKTLAFGERATGTDGKWPDDLRDPRVWHAFVSVLAAWVMVILVNEDEEKMKGRHHQQVEQATTFLTSARDAIQHYEADRFSLDRIWAALLELVWQTKCYLRGLLLALATPRRWTCLSVLDGLTLMIDNESKSWRLPMRLSLPEPTAIYKSYTAVTYVYAYPSVVIKVFNDRDSYTNESRAYEKLRHLQGYNIPEVYGCGKCKEDERPFLIFSNDGKRLPELREQDKAELEGLVNEIHANGIHHHDLHWRNVLRGSNGVLKLIDFGAAEFDCNCTDVWKEDWES